MPVLTIGLPGHLDRFINGLVEIGRHAHPDDVIVTALERYCEDIVSELCFSARIDAGEADMAALKAFLKRYEAAHPALPVPITSELKARIEILIGPIAEIDIDPDEPIEGDVDL